MPALPSFRLLIAGGGVAALEATLALRALAVGVEVELLAPEDEFTYRPLAVAGALRHGETIRFPLGQLADEAGATLSKGALSELVPDRRLARTTEGHEIEYDGCLLALGAVSRPAVPAQGTRPASPGSSMRRRQAPFAESSSHSRPAPAGHCPPTSWRCWPRCGSPMPVP